jgi:DNA-3-methyladenine glycosylase I
MVPGRPITRCPWPADDPLMIAYHDTEWGVPLHDDRRLFEFLVLEGVQAGLSWRTVLHKRENYRRTHNDFDPVKVARYTKRKIESLLRDPGIIRNRLKVASSVSNAKAFLQVVREFGSFDRYIWGFVKGKPIVNRWKTLKQLPAVTPLAELISTDLKSRGFRFVGPTIVYAHMQATGMVNDHLVTCFRHGECKGMR